LRGDPDTGLEWARRAIQVDPLAAPASYAELYVLYTAQRFEQAVECANRVLDLNPAYAEGRRCLGACLMALGQPRQALEQFRQAMTLPGPSGWLVAALAAAYARVGNTDETERLLAELEERASHEYVSPMALAVAYAALGRFDDALTQVERSFAQRDCWVVALGVDPAWAPLRGQPRFEAIIAKVGIMASPVADRSLPKLEYSQSA
jgi:tetratricopeptide (TPR) repeat protein